MALLELRLVLRVSPGEGGVAPTPVAGLGLLLGLLVEVLALRLLCRGSVGRRGRVGLGTEGCGSGRGWLGLGRAPGKVSSVGAHNGGARGGGRPIGGVVLRSGGS
jgi:hypothetical protein